VVVDYEFAELGWGVLVQELDKVEARSSDRDQFIDADLAFDLLVHLGDPDGAFSDDRLGTHGIITLSWKAGFCEDTK
jgi:hypothetical protein